MIIEVQKGNEEYFPVILKEYQHMIYKIISAYRLTQGDFFISKDDLYQEACLALHRQWAEKLRKRQPVPVLSLRYFGREERS